MKVSEGMNSRTVLTATIVWGVVTGLCAVVFLGFVMVGGAHVGKREQYRWDGQPMLIVGQNSNRSTNCEVVPDSGETRSLSGNFTQYRWSVKRYHSWFTGEATVTCNSSATIRTGAELDRYELVTKNRLVQIAGGVVVGGPFAAAVVFGRGRRKVSA